MFYKILMQTFSFYYNNSELTPYYKLSTQSCGNIIVGLNQGQLLHSQSFGLQNTHFCILHESGRTDGDCLMFMSISF